jgi:hypothetical protein
MYGLLCAGVSSSTRAIEESVRLIEDEILDGGPLWINSPKTAKKYLWALMMFSKLRGKERSRPVKLLLDGLNRFRRRDGSWSHMLNEEGDVHDTGLALMTLPSLSIKVNADSYSWLAASQNPDGGWGFHVNERSNPIATAVALEALSDKFRGTELVSRAISWLEHLQGDNGRWPLYYEPRLGWGYDVLIHFTTPWVLSALASAGRSLKSPSLLAGLNYLLGLQARGGGIRPTTEFPFCRNVLPLTWVTANSLAALSKLLRIAKVGE